MLNSTHIKRFIRFKLKLVTCCSVLNFSLRNLDFGCCYCYFFFYYYLDINQSPPPTPETTFRSYLYQPPHPQTRVGEVGFVLVGGLVQAWRGGGAKGQVLSGGCKWANVRETGEVNEIV